MAHHTLRSTYSRLARRLNRAPLGAPPSELLYRILGILFSEKESALAARLPVRPFTVRQAAKVWNVDEASARKDLVGMCDRLILLDVVSNDETWYVLPPPMAGFFEFALMQVRDDCDQRLLSQLFFQYVNVEEDFSKMLFLGGETKLGRVLVDENTLSPKARVEALDFERATDIVTHANHIGVGLCYCRHKMSHMGRACAAPLDVCLVLNMAGSSLVNHGAARRVEAEEALDILQRGRDLGLVQLGENVREGMNFICNCCPCCCDPLLAVRRFGLVHTLATTGYLPEVDGALCNGCSSCVISCPTATVAVSSAGNGQKACVDETMCLGCGICVKRCTKGAVTLVRRPRRLITPRDSFHRTVLMAVERGTLQELIFDNDALGNHRAMSAILGAILKLPAVKRALAQSQLGSRYLEKVAEKIASSLR